VNGGQWQSTRQNKSNNSYNQIGGVMDTTTKVFKYDSARDDWKEFIAAMNSGQIFEIDEENYYYWLEILPPIYMGQTQIINGQPIRCSFGFAEGREYIKDFWTKDGRFFGKMSDRLNRGY